MEKISNIVRGSPRVASVDLKSSSAVRPGTPSYGRPVGETATSYQPEGTTASRAAALNAQLRDQRRTGPDRTIEGLADSFFMSRIRRPEDNQQPQAGVPAAPGKTAGPGKVAAPEVKEMASAEDAQEANLEAHDAVDSAPEEYTPRGSFVDVRA